MARVFIGVGHGGYDPGACANGFKESELNLAISLACRDELERHGVVVGMSRTVEENDVLSEEIAECNAFAPDLAVEIHNNAGGGDGVEVFHTHLLGKGKTLAQNIIDEVMIIGQNSRGTKIRKNDQGNDYFGWIRQCKAPAVLVECAFMDTKDIEIIDTPEEQKVMGIAIAKGVLKTLGISHQEPTTTTTTSSYKVQLGEFSSQKEAENFINNLKALVNNISIVEDKIVVENKVETPTTPTDNENGGKETVSPQISVGCRVKLKSGAKTYTGGGLASFVYEWTLDVSEIKGDRVVVKHNGAVIAAVNINDLILV